MNPLEVTALPETLKCHPMPLWRFDTIRNFVKRLQVLVRVDRGNGIDRLLESGVDIGLLDIFTGGGSRQDACQ